MSSGDLQRAPVIAPSDIQQADDGNYYHLPTLRALHRAGRLAVDTPGWRLLFPPGQERKCDA